MPSIGRNQKCLKMRGVKLARWLHLQQRRVQRSQPLGGGPLSSPLSMLAPRARHQSNLSAFIARAHFCSRRTRNEAMTPSAHFRAVSLLDQAMPKAEAPRALEPIDDVGEGHRLRRALRAARFSSRWRSSSRHSSGVRVFHWICGRWQNELVERLDMPPGKTAAARAENVEVFMGDPGEGADSRRSAGCLFHCSRCRDASLYQSRQRVPRPRW